MERRRAEAQEREQRSKQMGGEWERMLEASANESECWRWMHGVDRQKASNLVVNKNSKKEMDVAKEENRERLIK